MGVAIFHFSHKIGLKSTTNMRFCLLHKPMGGAQAPPPPPLATLLDVWEVEIATAQRTLPRAVVGAPRRAACQLKSALRHSISAAPRTKIFLHFFTIIVGDFLFMNNNG